VKGILEQTYILSSAANLLMAANRLRMGNPMTIEVQVRSVYGRNRIYPMNATATKFTELLKRKTFEKEDLAILKDMGFAIKWMPFTVQLG
jgi:hypothetical protein